MAEFDYQRALDKAFQPLHTLGAGRVAIAEAELRHKRKLEQEAVERSFRLTQARTYRDSALELQKQADLNAIAREERASAEGLVVENRKRGQKEKDELKAFVDATGYTGDINAPDVKEKASAQGTETLGALLDQRDAADAKVLAAMKVDEAKVELDAKEAFLNDPGNKLDAKSKQVLRNNIHNTPAFTALLAKKDSHVIEDYNSKLKEYKATAIENGRNNASVLARAALSRYDSLNMEIAKLQRVLPAGVTAKAFLQRGEAPPHQGLPGTYDHTGTLIAGGGDDETGLRPPPEVTVEDEAPSRVTVDGKPYSIPGAPQGRGGWESIKGRLGKPEAAPMGPPPVTPNIEPYPDPWGTGANTPPWHPKEEPPPDLAGQAFSSFPVPGSPPPPPDPYATGNQIPLPGSTGSAPVTPNISGYPDPYGATPPAWMAGAVAPTPDGFRDPYRYGNQQPRYQPHPQRPPPPPPGPPPVTPNIAGSPDPYGVPPPAWMGPTGHPPREDFIAQQIRLSQQGAPYAPGNQQVMSASQPIPPTPQSPLVPDHPLGQPVGAEQFRVAQAKEKVMAVLAGADVQTVERAAQMFSFENKMPPQLGQKEFSNAVALASENPNGQEHKMVRHYLKKSADAAGQGGAYLPSAQHEPAPIASPWRGTGLSVEPPAKRPPPGVYPYQDTFFSSPREPRYSLPGSDLINGVAP